MATYSSAYRSTWSSRLARHRLGGVATPTLGQHPRGAQQVGDPGVLEALVEVEVGEGLHGQVHGEVLAVPAGLVERVLDDL